MAKQGKPVTLSKSKFVAGLQCLKRLYWTVHELQLKPALDKATLAVLDQGTEVGEAAHQAFPGGVAVQGGYWDVEGVLRHTAQLMANPDVPAIFEAAFLHEKVLVRADVLERRARDRWRLIEVKSSTRVKDEHLPDVAIQKHVVEGTGVRLDAAELMHLNGRYVFDGKTLVPQELFTRANVTKEAEAFQKDIPRLLRQQWDALQQEKPPDIAPGTQCKSPYECEFYQLCNPILPGDHVSFMPGLRQNRKQELLDQGIASIKDISATFPLTDLQRRVRDCVCSGVPCFSGQIVSELAELRYPLFFTDFETFNPAIPRFAGMRPYGTFPFQWSIHVQSEPGASLEHHEFLACDGTDPREPFISSLLAILEKNADGHVVCYSKYEATQLAALARWLPGYARRIEKVQRRVWDILAFIRKHVYHPDFGGSFSLKQVLPALVPDMTYAGMTVADGTQAGLAYHALVRGTLPETERLELHRALLAYCAQDTLAMVSLVERLRKV